MTATYNTIKANWLSLSNRFAHLQDFNKDNESFNGSAMVGDTCIKVRGNTKPINVENTESSLAVVVKTNECINNRSCSSTNVKDTVSVVRAVPEAKGKTVMNKVNIHDLNDKCTDLKTCVQQQDNVFVFLPITNLRRLKISQSLKPNKILSHKEYDPVTVHKTERATGKPNFEEAKIQLPSKINFKLFEELCKGHWDYQLPYFIKFGFPIDFPHDLEHKLQYRGKNHSSAVKFLIMSIHI